MEMINTFKHRESWNKGKLVGQKAPFKLKEIWAIRTRLQMAGRSRDLALFDLGIDSKLRGLRPGQAPRARCVPRRSDRPACDPHATKNPTTGSV